MEWKKLVSDYSNVNSRFGHTGVLFQKKLILFGGKFKNNNYFFMGDLEVFNLEDKSWTVPIVYTKSTLKLRSNHIAEIIGKIISNINQASKCSFMEGFLMIMKY